jgi:hypothetical protein
MQVMGLGNGKWMLALAAISLTACGGDSTAPPSAAGTFAATSFVTTSNSGQVTDQIANGSFLLIILAPDGTTSGNLHIAASGSVPALDADMAGTWTMTGGNVTFTQTADTFVRNMTFSFTQPASFTSLLRGDEMFSDGTRVQLTLSSVPLE